jgi:hypothetical protein
MDSSHRLHPVHTVQTKSDSAALAQASEKACNSCLEPLSQTEQPAFHCDQCDYTVCESCDRPMCHPQHPHSLYLTDVRPVYHQFNGNWNCDICGKSNDAAGPREL